MPRKSETIEKSKRYNGGELPEFCKRVKIKRLEMKITQEELARKIGTTTPRISQLEKGRFPRDEKRIIALAYALDVDVNWLFGFNERE